MEANGIRTPVLHEGDFANRPVGSPGWPIEQCDLTPYYLEAGAGVGISPVAIRNAVSRNSAISSGHGAKEDGTPNRETPTGLGALHPFWCVEKRHIAEPTTERFGGARVLTDAPVWRLLLDTQGRVTAAVVRAADGRTLEVHATNFVLAAGTYASTRILLESSWSGGSAAANSSGLLGVGLMDHPILNLGTITPDMAGSASAHHGAGTVRMSASADTGVVDTKCRTYDHPNLFVVGSAVFPSQGFANPTLTDIALGLRLGELLA